MSIESNTHAFVVRIWSEGVSDRENRAKLRGHITHAYTKERRSVQELEDILLFMRPFMAEMDVDLSLRSRLIMFVSSIGRKGLRSMGAATRKKSGTGYSTDR